jgi:hypothetical protein
LKGLKDEFMPSAVHGLHGGGVNREDRRVNIEGRIRRNPYERNDVEEGA